MRNKNCIRWKRIYAKLHYALVDLRSVSRQHRLNLQAAGTIWVNIGKRFKSSASGSTLHKRILKPVASVLRG